MSTRLFTPCALLLLCVGFGSLLGCGEPELPEEVGCEAGTAGEDCAPCEAGTYCAGGEAEAVVCGVGTWDGGDVATECVAWTDCEPGEFIESEGSATEDRQCLSCEEGTYSVNPNSSVCQPHGECAAGTVEVEAGTETEPAVCEACEVGTYCAGGDAPAVECEEGSWDHDANPASQCVAMSECVAGEYVLEEGTATSDRVCEGCAEGAFSSEANAAECTPWSNCGSDRYVVFEGSESSDRLCQACPYGQYSEGPNAEFCRPELPMVGAGEEHSCVLLEDSSLWCWGKNLRGQLGLGNFDDRHEPERVGVGPLAQGWKSFSTAWNHTCGIREDSTLWCWGDNLGRQLGLGHSTNQVAPVQVLAADAQLAEGWASVSAGWEHSCGVREDSTLWCWGSGTGGKLGLGGTTTESTPQQVLASDPQLAQGWSSVSAGGRHTCAVREDSTLWCWGGNWRGGLGLGDTDDRDTPVQVLADDIGLAIGWKEVSTGASHTCALRQDSTLWCWGINSMGVLGLGDRTPRHSPEQVLADDLDLALGWVSVTTGEYHGCAVREDTSLWCWGDNWQGKLGAGDLQDRTTPQRVLEDDGALAVGWVSVASGRNHSCAFRDDDSLYCWGSNRVGQLGRGDDSGDKSRPVSLEVAQTFEQIDAGDAHGCGVASDTSLWCWGYNWWGQLGLDLGQQEERSTPEQVLAESGQLATGWESISAGRRHSCAVREDSTLWCWGNNFSGQLGLGDTTWRLAPEQVLATDGPLATEWESVSAGGDHSCAVREDSTLWCWGRNDASQLGMGDTTDRTLPEQVLANDGDLATGWASVSVGDSHSCAVREDFTLWCWGDNWRGKLGLGDTDVRATPEQVLAEEATLATGWESVSAGADHSCAVRDDTTLWCWGDNWRGKLGLGNTVNRTDPEQVLAADPDLATGWESVSAGTDHSCAVRDDTTLWCWGEGAHGRLGLHHTSSQHTPQEVEGEWTAVSTGGEHTHALSETLGAYSWGRNNYSQLGDGSSRSLVPALVPLP